MIVGKHRRAHLLYPHINTLFRLAQRHANFAPLDAALVTGVFADNCFVSHGFAFFVGFSANDSKSFTTSAGKDLAPACASVREGVIAVRTLKDVQAVLVLHNDQRIDFAGFLDGILQRLRALVQTYFLNA